MKKQEKSYKWLNSWHLPWHEESRKENFQILDNYLKSAPNTILDIGCGLARESEYFQKKYETKLWLLDGDFDSTKEKPRDNQWGDAESFKFYSPIDDLKNSWNARGLDYTFVNALDINIDKNLKFDVIYSLLSCGFHYPAKTYRELILNHSHENTVVIIDCRFDTLTTQLEDFDIIEKIKTYDHYYKLHINFKNI